MRQRIEGFSNHLLISEKIAGAIDRHSSAKLLDKMSKIETELDSSLLAFALELDQPVRCQLVRRALSFLERHIAALNVLGTHVFILHLNDTRDVHIDAWTAILNAHRPDLRELLA